MEIHEVATNPLFMRSALLDKGLEGQYGQKLFS